MITITYAGRYGNKLFQFFAANIFSRKFKDGITNPLDTRLIYYDPLPPLSFERTVEVTDENFMEFLHGSTGLTNFHFASNYQTEEIVNEFDRNRHILTSFDTSPTNGVFVHVRLGDLLSPFYRGTGNKHIPFEYYDLALDGLGFSDGYISSDTPDHEIVTHLKNKYQLISFSASEDDTLIFASKCNMKVLSLGTFSWWIGFMGNQRCVIYPDQFRCIKWHGDIFTFKHWKKV
jgi:hypothetical protein